MRIIASLITLLFMTIPAFAQQCITTPPPKHAIVLVKGDDNSQWKAQNGEACSWPTKDGVMTVSKTNIMTRRNFTDVQLHIEFQIPPRTKQDDHGHGNSGVYLHGDYEIQVIDSFGREPDYKSSCGAIYGQAAPLVDASLPTEKWQSFDVIFRAPRYDAKGKALSKARLTVIHNGILIHDHVECEPTPGALTDHFKTAGPLWLQVHGYAVRYRNIWIRELPTLEANKDSSSQKGK